MLKQLVVHSGDAARSLQTGAAFKPDSINAMRPAWRLLAEESDLPSTQFEWTLAAIGDLVRGAEPYVAYVSDGATLRAVLPLISKREMGVEHLYFASPDFGVPIDIPHADGASLKVLLQHVLKKGRPVVLPRLLETSAVLPLINGLARERRLYIVTEPSEPATAVALGNYPLQDRSHSAARVSILAASYGLSGGPNDVIFQYASPTIEQVMSLYHEALQLNGEAGDPEAGSRGKAKTVPVNEQEFLRVQVYHGVQRGEIRFAALRLAGRLLAMQIYQVRQHTAWLLRASHMERFRKTIVETLLLGETVRKLQTEGATRIVVPAGEAMPELPHTSPIPMVNVKLYPWGSRSLTALMLGRAGGISGKLLRWRGGKIG